MPDPGLNPHTSNTAQVDRYGQESSSGLAPFNVGSHTTNMSEPANPEVCHTPGREREVEFIVVPPAGVTGYTVRWGRWLRDKSFVRQPPAAVGELGYPLNNWLEDGNAAHTDVLPKSIRMETRSDPCSVYVDAIAGTPTGDQVFRFFIRRL